VPFLPSPLARGCRGEEHRCQPSLGGDRPGKERNKTAPCPCAREKTTDQSSASLMQGAGYQGSAWSAAGWVGWDRTWSPSCHQPSRHLQTQQQQGQAPTSLPGSKHPNPLHTLPATSPRLGAHASHGTEGCQHPLAPPGVTFPAGCRRGRARCPPQPPAGNLIVLQTAASRNTGCQIPAEQ